MALIAQSDFVKQWNGMVAAQRRVLVSVTLLHAETPASKQSNVRGKDIAIATKIPAAAARDILVTLVDRNLVIKCDNGSFEPNRLVSDAELAEYIRMVKEGGSGRTPDFTVMEMKDVMIDLQILPPREDDYVHMVINERYKRETLLVMASICPNFREFKVGRISKVDEVDDSGFANALERALPQLLKMPIVVEVIRAAHEENERNATQTQEEYDAQQAAQKKAVADAGGWAEWRKAEEKREEIEKMEKEARRQQARDELIFQTGSKEVA